MLTLPLAKTKAKRKKTNKKIKEKKSILISIYTTRKSWGQKKGGGKDLWRGVQWEEENHREKGMPGECSVC